jgi:hypothetical protein
LRLGEGSLRRRDFIQTIGSAAAWPLAGRAQQGERMRRIGVLITLAAGDPYGQAQVAAFQKALQELNWSDGRNVRMDFRWAGGELALARCNACSGSLLRLCLLACILSSASTDLDERSLQWPTKSLTNLNSRS